MADKERARIGPARRTALWGILAALAVALSFVEGWLPPLPVPGAKLGLSNIVTMYCLGSLGLPAAMAVTAVKAGFALLRGGTACLMSFCGGMLSTLLMALCLRARRAPLSYIGVGVLGAAAHNLGQLGAAMFLLEPALVHYLPVLLLVALPTGAVTGLTLNLTLPALARLRLPSRAEE